jgi:4-amino-4-deoxy-L-arabinose transferase-like glycosyltransferase
VICLVERINYHPDTYDKTKLFVQDFLLFLAAFWCAGMADGHEPQLFAHRGRYGKPLIKAMIYPHFSGVQIAPFVAGALVLLASILSFQAGRKRAALWLLFAGALLLGFFIAALDDFLIIWDEQYHALVAKNMLRNPFMPLLYADPPLEYDYRNWIANHVWLHKQPLFLWQIALSLKFFGINALAVRIPSIIMHALAALMVYRTGKIIHNEKTGFYGALFFTVSYYLLGLVAGKITTDHNDTAFLFYVTASLWAWFEYRESGKKRWLILTGLFSGFAVLVKWLVGLLVYAVWVSATGLDDKRHWLKAASYRHLLTALAVTLLVFLPWQIYIFTRFPAEAAHELSLNTRHFFHVVEGHGGNFWFHFRAVKDIYGSGDLVPYLLLLGLFFLLRKARAGVYRFAVLSAIIITYGFYSFAATKMTSFCIIVSPFAFLGLGALTDAGAGFLHDRLRLKYFDRIFRPLALIVICYFLINMTMIQASHTNWKPHDNRNRKADREQMAFIGKLKSLQNRKYVVFNADIRHQGHIAVMFYTGHVSYGFIPDRQQLEEVRDQSYGIAIADKGDLPDYILNDGDILIIEVEGNGR